MLSRRFLLVQILLSLASCAVFRTNSGRELTKLTIGIVSYGEGVRSIEEYGRFVDYLQKQTNTLIELEPAYNEIKAIEQIKRQAWDLVFASPGLAAIAISQANYIPLFPLQGKNRYNTLRAVFIVLKQSPMQKLADLAQQKIALGQPGSATNYYIPLYDLYGAVLAEIILAPTPQDILEYISKGEVAAGALSEEEFNTYRSQFKPTEFRIIYISRQIPIGAVLINPKVKANQKQKIKQAMTEISSELAQDTGYIPNIPPSDYTILINMINRVKSIEAHIREKPARLFSM
ncbi:phosphate/phosphite/phosphonate ABC transporter substrate-binding protein [Floridanema aerugineum]|uniref:Phosphate/phosphite/phosphonate ABC transporter substrate-binding protein n=1 Tax=Floridaenema aerugineum BLCC-F46 TaxID=3153654 RepID=A0ABV4XEM2_9CYAN